jgi:hypothetical protein
MSVERIPFKIARKSTYVSNSSVLECTQYQIERQQSVAKQGIMTFSQREEKELQVCSIIRIP